MQWCPLVFIVISVLSSADARHNATQSLRAHHLAVATPGLFVQLGQSASSCRCVFDDQCTCEGALRFMECVKNACNSGDCMCIESNGVNHFLESCQAMQGECSEVGLVCGAQKSTCDAKGVAWNFQGKSAEIVKPDPRKYILHTKHKAKVKELNSYVHRAFAQGTVVTLVVLCMTIALVRSSNSIVAKHTWSIIDFVIVTFLALSWFVVVIHSLDYLKLTGWHAILAHMIVAVLFLFASEMISFRLSGESAAVFNGIFTPMVMWTNAGFVETVQKNYQGSPWKVGAFFLVLALWYALLLVFFHLVVKKLTAKKKGDKAEDAMVGGALAGGFVLFSHLLVTGSYSPLEDRKSTSLYSAWMLNILGVAYLVISIAGLVFISPRAKTLREREESLGDQVGPTYWKLRLCGIADSFLQHLPRFSFIVSLAHIVCDHMGYAKGSIGAQLLLAFTSTMIGIFLIMLCAYLPLLNRNTIVAKDTSAMLIGLGGFMVGVAWSNMLDNSISMVTEGEGYAHPFEVKLAVTGFLTAFIFPVYYNHLKPIITERLAEK